MSLKVKKNKDKNKLKLREKIAFACFMEGVPALINLWQRECPDVTFDKWLLDIYTQNKARKE